MKAEITKHYLQMGLSTPCIGTCLLDAEAGICVGCGRTGQEIADWIAMGEEARRAVMAGLAARLAGLHKSEPAPPDREMADD